MVDEESDEVANVRVKFGEEEEQNVLLSRCSAEFEYAHNKFITRYQFPLNLAYAITIHRSQGLTIKSALIDLSDGSLQMAALAYVALSRIKSLQGLYLIGLGYASVFADSKAIAFYNRQRTQNGLPKVLHYNVRPTMYQKVCTTMQEVHIN